MSHTNIVRLHRILLGVMGLLMLLLAWNSLESLFTQGLGCQLLLLVGFALLLAFICLSAAAGRQHIFDD